jgi:leucyl/phenylalanyl-tRNA--protein transferase
LVEILRDRGFGLLDIQWVTEHLGNFGAVEVRRHAYLKLLHAAMVDSCVFHAAGPWSSGNSCTVRGREAVH